MRAVLNWHVYCIWASNQFQQWSSIKFFLYNAPLEQAIWLFLFYICPSRIAHTTREKTVKFFFYHWYLLRLSSIQSHWELHFLHLLLFVPLDGTLIVRLNCYSRTSIVLELQSRFMHVKISSLVILRYATGAFGWISHWRSISVS